MGRGSSKAGKGGGGATIAAQGPKEVEGENRQVDVRLNDGTHAVVNVSVQDTSQLDDLKNVDYVAKYDGSRTKANSGPVYNQLASEAERNALKPTNKVFDDPGVSEGRYSKADVPVLKRVADGVILDKASGYATKINGETFYIQKRANNEWVPNCMGMSLGKTYKSYTAAKNGIAQDAAKVFALGKSLSLAKGQFAALNGNQGKISGKVWKEIDFNYIGNRL